MESVFFILNIHEISFRDLINNIEIDTTKLWESFNDFLRSDPTMPSPLKYHLLDIEIKIISFYIWRKNSSLLQILKEYLTSDQELGSLSNVGSEKDFEKENQNKLNLIINLKKNNQNISSKEKKEYDVNYA